jgi:hypothetical protein
MGAPATSSRLLAALLLAAQLVVPPAATSTPNRPHRGHTGEPPPKCMGGCGKDGRPGPCCCPGCTPTGNMPGTECGPGRISSYGCNMGCGSFCCCPLVNATSCGKKCVSDRDCSAGSNCSTCELHPSPKGVVRACGGKTSATAAAGRGTSQSARPQLNGSSPRRGKISFYATGKIHRQDPPTAMTEASASRAIRATLRLSAAPMDIPALPAASATQRRQTALTLRSITSSGRATAASRTWV